MIQSLMVNCKNGPNGYVLHYWEIDTSKPRCYVEGMHYKFNSKLVRSEYVQEKKNGK